VDPVNLGGKTFETVRQNKSFHLLNCFCQVFVRAMKNSFNDNEMSFGGGGSLKQQQYSNHL
jgi:hypothetical protein